MEFEILLFYKYIKIEDPEGFADKQRNLCVDNDTIQVIIGYSIIHNHMSVTKEFTSFDEWDLVIRNQIEVPE